MLPCLVCGELSESSRCPEHRVKQHKASATQRGYRSWWERLSKQARTKQPFCTDCGSTENLTVDHTPEAWAKVESGKRLTLNDFKNGLLTVVCRTCNIARGAARGNSASHS